MSGGRAVLVSSHARDLDVVLAARVSGGSYVRPKRDKWWSLRRPEPKLMTYEEEYLEHQIERAADPSSRDKGLINYLLSKRHGTPFEHNYFRFHVIVPIFAQRDWFRHRVGHSFNEVSTRWQDMDALGVYEPDLLRTQIGKPHEYQYEEFDPTVASMDEKLKHWYRRRYLIRTQKSSMRRYRRMLKRGYAREQAMAALPMGTYTEFYWSCNARSLMHFLGLRTAPGVRKEIREVAAQIEQQFAEQMPLTYDAFVANGRVAP